MPRDEGRGGGVHEVGEGQSRLRGLPGSRNYITPNRAAYTTDEYRRLINKSIEPALGNMRLDRLSPRQLDAFYRSLQEKGLSGSSIRQHRSILHASLGRAVKWGLIAANPADQAGGTNRAPKPRKGGSLPPKDGGSGAECSLRFAAPGPTLLLVTPP